jgi:hypothetical protein
MLEGLDNDWNYVQKQRSANYTNLPKGTYIFKIFARSQNQEKCSGGATAVEKMVLLK